MKPMNRKAFFNWLILLGSVLAVLPPANGQDTLPSWVDCSKKPNACPSADVTATNKPTGFVFTNGFKKVLEISAKGEIIFAEGVTPSEAAQQFAETLKKVWPTMFECEKPAGVSTK